MKLTIKLKHTELVSLVDLMAAMIEDNEAQCRTDVIIAVLMLKFYKKLKEKTILMEPRKYSFQVAPETALSFIEFFSMMPLDRYSHAGNIIDRMIRQFDQETTHLIN